MISARGGVEFRVNGVKIDNEEESLLKSHPVGSYFITEDYTFDPIVEFGGTWERVEGGRALWTTITDGEGGVKVSAGLPNVYGTFRYGITSRSFLHATDCTGAFKSYASNSCSVPGGASGINGHAFVEFSAEYHNSIYGNSSTVQPPAIKVYIWRRLPDEE